MGQRLRYGIRLLHAERQPLRRQPARGQPVRRRHPRGGGLRRGGRPALRVDRRAPFQHAGCAFLSRSGTGQCRGSHETHPPRPRRPVLPLHHPIRVAEQWATLDLLSGGRVDFAAGRGYDRREYLPLNVSFEHNQEIFEEGMEVVRRLWSADRPISHHGRHYRFDDVAITPKPVQRPLPAYVASFSQPSIELAGRLGCGLIVAPFAAAMTYGGLRQVAELYHQTCARHERAPGQLMCSYFIHFADTKGEKEAARARQIRYYKECVIAAFPGDPKTAPPSDRYFIDIVDRLHQVRPQDLGENSVLLGSTAQIVDTLKKVEAAGVAEVILYANVGLKPHPQVKDEMARFMTEIAPQFT